MPANLLELPAELRIRIFELVLLAPAPIALEKRHCHPGEQRPEVSLLRVNKKMNSEATPFFYGQNEFQFTYSPTRKETASFLDRMGRNATLIRSIYLYIDFPLLTRRQGLRATIDHEATNYLSILPRKCINVRTLTLSKSFFVGINYATGGSHSDELREALDACNTNFRAFPQLEDIFIDSWTDTAFRHARDEIAKMGWKVKQNQ
jgi:hypothetical protein